MFRGGANFVNVDVYPRRDGRLVEGLTAADFQIFEDGKPQKIEHFEFIKVAMNTPDASRRDPNTQREAERLVADPYTRVFVIYLDDYNLTLLAARELRRPLREFLERVIGPSDLFAVMFPDTPLPHLIFGQRLDVVETALDQFSKRMQFDRADSTVWSPRTPAEGWLWRCYITRTEDPKRNEAFVMQLIDLLRTDAVFTSLEQLAARLALLREERTHVLLFSAGWRVGTPADTSGMAWGAEGGQLPRIGVTRGGRITTDPTQPDETDKTKCDAEMLRLTAMDLPRRFVQLVEGARRGNVSFTTIDPGGLIPPFTIGALSQTQGAARLQNLMVGRIDSLRTLAENTDGTAIVNTNDIGPPLRRFADDIGVYYLLGYYSTNMNHDGRYRRIEVKTAQPNLKIAARPGYRAVTAELARAMESAPAPRMGTTQVEDALGALGRVRTSADLLTYGAAWPGRLAIIVELPAGPAPQTRWPSGADVQVSILSAAGDVVGAATGRIEPSTRGVLLYVPLNQSTPGPWRASVRVGSSADQLEDRLEIGATSDGPIGPPLLFRAVHSMQSPVRPTADRQFLRTERLHVEWPARASVDRHEARVLGRNGQPLALSVPVVERQTDGQTVLAVDLNLAPLAAGDYVLELTAARGVRTDRSLVAFRIVR